jgi:MFS family permease
VSTTPARRDPTGLARLRVRARPPLPVVFAITVTGILANTLINAPLPDIVDDLGVPDASAGLLVAAGTLPGIVIAPIIGLLADRYGRRQVLIPCLTIFGVAGVAGAFAPTFEVLLATRALQGVGSAGLINLAVVLLADSWDGAARAKVIGQNAAVLTISIAITPALGGLLAEAGGWRASFAPYGLALVTAGAAWLLVPERSPGAPCSCSSSACSSLRCRCCWRTRSPSVRPAAASCCPCPRWARRWWP